MGNGGARVPFCLHLGSYVTFLWLRILAIITDDLVTVMHLAAGRRKRILCPARRLVKLQHMLVPSNPLVVNLSS